MVMNDSVNSFQHVQVCLQEICGHNQYQAIQCTNIIHNNGKMKLLDNIRIGLYHAAYHRNLRYAQEQKQRKNINQFKKYVYRAENAWRRLVLIQEKYKNE